MPVSSTCLLAMLMAALSGYGVVHHGGEMMRQGVTVSEGGGWTALVLVESMVCFASVALALALA